MFLLHPQSMNRMLKRCLIPLAALIIFAAVVSSVFRALTPWAKQYKGEVEKHLSTLLGQPVTINTMETGWYWFEPVIKLKQLSTSNQQGKSIQLNQLIVGINLFQSVWQWKIQPGILYLDDMKLTIHQEKDNWQVDGLTFKPSSELGLDLSRTSPLLGFILAEEKILVRNVTLQVYLKDGTFLPIRQLNATVLKRYDHYKMSGGAYLAQIPATSVKVVADLEIDPSRLTQPTGQLFLSANFIELSQWQRYFKESRFIIHDGEVDASIWLDGKKGKLTALQSRIAIRDLKLEDTLTKKKQNIPVFKANMAFTPSRDGWSFSADKIKMTYGDIDWPKNKVMVQYRNGDNVYTVYVKDIFIASTLAIAQDFPDLEPMMPKSILELKPHGHLYDTQVSLKNGQVDSMLTRFSGVRWQSKDKIPGIDKLNGVILWTPTEGRFALDSTNVAISSPPHSKVTLTNLNTALSWKPSAHGLQFHLDELVINHPDLKVNASGVVDDVEKNSVGQIDLLAKLSLTNAERWIAFIPNGLLKDKFTQWLKEDIKTVGQVLAEVNIHGLAADFPFQDKPGEFTIKGYVRGVDLRFNHDWPITKDIDASIDVNKRKFEANITHANLSGTEVSQGNLRIDDIGLDHENLLIHTVIDAHGKKVLDYIASSPLRRKLSVLSLLQMKGDVTLDLKCEIPLYPENDNVLLQGNVLFKNDEITANHALGNIKLSQLTGSLRFDEAGVLGSQMSAVFVQHPVSILIQSIRGSNPYTQVKIKGKTSIDALSKLFNIPSFGLIQGDLWLAIILTLTDEPNDFDHLSFQSLLTDVAIDFPSPLGKAKGVKAPLALDIDFNAEKAVKVHANYDERMKSELWFDKPKGQYQLQKGLISLGKSKVQSPKEKGLEIKGEIPIVEGKQWARVFSTLSSSNSEKGITDVVQRINLVLKKVILGSLEYIDVSIRAVKTPENNWQIVFDEKSMAGKVLYRPVSNSLTGVLSKLHLPKGTKTAKQEPLEIKANQLPSLDVSIQSLKYDGFNLGQASLKTTAKKNAWQVNACTIATPSYQINARGEWTQEKLVNLSKLEATLTSRNLAKTLEEWKISPVVEARQGILQFQGAWPGAFYDFSWTGLRGRATITLKDGRITHLSKETEEKIGLGKLLSILSLQTIPRRLMLDFSDLSHKGYSFDKFKGNFNIMQGIMSTQDSYIDGPIAYASMKGNLDIAKQLYDLELKVSPHVTASLPIVATIAGGPVAGIATWLVSKVINRGMHFISGYTYQISGPWKSPVVKQLNIIKKENRRQ